MVSISKPFTFYAGEKAKANEVNENFDIVYAGVNELDRKVTDVDVSILEINDGKADINGNAQQAFQVADALTTYEAINKGQLTRMFPVGTIIPIHSESVANDDTWLVCDGSAFEIDDYAELYGVIGTTYGTAEGNRFRVPDMSNRTLWGKASDVTYGTVEAGLPNITGKFTGSANASDSTTNGAFVINHLANAWGDGGPGQRAAQCSFDAARSNSIYGRSSTVQPPAIKVTFLIKHS